MNKDSGILSVDFLVGFTIFLVAFIWIATLIPTLFLGLSTQGIDFDAVAYRTGVILAEDPGATTPNATAGTPWETQSINKTVARFGFAISKETPNILDENKVERFFCSTLFVYPDDYRTKAIFGDYPYRFNISLNVTGEDHNWTVGDVLPDNYGYIRRDVRFKGSSNATINNRTMEKFHYNTTQSVMTNWFSIRINSSNLVNGDYRTTIVNPNKDIAYRINPNWDRIMINITNLETTRPPASPSPPPLPGRSDINLSSVRYFKTTYGDPNLYVWAPSGGRNLSIYEDGNTSPVRPPVDIRNNLSMIFDHGFFYDPDQSAVIYVNLTFGGNEMAGGGNTMMQFLNNSQSQAFDYNYNPANVTQPVLRDGVMEIAVW